MPTLAAPMNAITINGSPKAVRSVDETCGLSSRNWSNMQTKKDFQFGLFSFTFCRRFLGVRVYVYGCMYGMSCLKAAVIVADLQN